MHIVHFLQRLKDNLTSTIRNKFGNDLFFARHLQCIVYRSIMIFKFSADVACNGTKEDVSTECCCLNAVTINADVS
jgi:hypothetical protein